MKESDPSARESGDNVVKLPIRSPYSDGNDAYSDLGGGLQAYREPEMLPVHRNLSFFDIYELTPESALLQPEVHRVYDLSLNETLRSDHIGQLAKKDAETLVVAVYDLCNRLDHLAPLLLLEGNYENPTFEKYQLQSQEQANQYAGVLFALRDGLDERPVVKQLLARYKEQYPYKAAPQRKLDEARRLQGVVVDENDKMTLEYSGTPAPLRLRSV